MIPTIILSALCPGNASSIVCFLSAGPNVWFPIVMAAALAIIAVVAIIYQLSPLLGRNDIKVWARAKIYDAFVTIILAIIFLSFSTMIVSVNPVSAYSSVGLLPQLCNPSVNSNIPSSSNINDIYGISICDMYQFNQYVSIFSEGIYIFSIIGGLNPSTEINFPPPDGRPGFPISTAAPVSGEGAAVVVQFLPIVLVHQYVVPALGAYFLVVLTSQLLQILLSSSGILFSIFLVLGLIARSFGVTKSFGGAMIAFGLGLGVIFPLMASMTYGFIDVAIVNSVSVNTLLNFLFLPLVVTPSSLFFTLSTILTPLILFGGLVSAGLIFIPLLNLIVVDAFIVDFSKAIGERMDLFSILTRII
ncbi:MAG: hypothetical protein ACYCO0_01545 [Candidatus Micrarchaeaceae archaeon]